MLFSNFVATIRADLDAIKDDLGEFVTVVKSDTTAILGLAPGANRGGGATGASASQGGNKTVVQWDEELYDNPDLMCEDPKEDDWEAFVASNPVKEDEVEMMLSGSYSDLIPELYRELVPSRTTHSDFFKRLVYHRNRLSKAMKSKVHELVSQDEEETGWEDDDEAPVLPVTTPAHKSTAPAVESAALEQARKETAVLKDELDRVKEELARSQLRIEQLERMLEEKQTVAISDELSHKKKPVPIDVQEKQAPLTAKEEERAPVISEKEEEEEQQQEVVVPVNHPPTQVTEDDEQEEEEEAQEVIMSTPATTKSTIAPSVATASWEDLPTSPASSSNEEPVMLNKADELEEDDWE